MPTYPTLRIGQVQALLAMRADAVSDENYFGPECPYDPEMIEALRDLLRGPAVVGVVAAAAVEETRKGGAGRPKKVDPLKAMSAESSSTVAEELVAVRRDLDKLREDSKQLTDVSDRIAIIKASVALIERMTVLDERQFSIKRMSRFQSVVISILDDLVKGDDRAIFMTRLAGFAEEE